MAERAELVSRIEIELRTLGLGDSKQWITRPIAYIRSTCVHTYPRHLVKPRFQLINGVNSRRNGATVQHKVVLTPCNSSTHGITQLALDILQKQCSSTNVMQFTYDISHRKCRNCASVTM